MGIDPKIVDQLMAGYKTPEDIAGENGLLKQLTKAVLERALQVEMTDHVGYDVGDPAGRGTGNSRNGLTSKTVATTAGPVTIDVPRDRNGSFEPRIGNVEQRIFLTLVGEPNHLE